MRRVLCLTALLMLLCAAAAGADGVPPPSAPGQRGSHVLRLQQALVDQGYLSGPADGLYGPRTAEGLRAFQRARGLNITGFADEESLRLLFAPPPPEPGQTLRPYWYGGGSGLIPIGARFEIRDVRSGITFGCVRIMGVSHLDAEPLTPEDTARMLTAYGGKWAWDRRPILLNYRGQVIAASMNGKPHGWEVIPGNDMTGHFCVHMFGARGDGSQRVDPDHLACAVEASQARWE